MAGEQGGLRRVSEYPFFFTAAGRQRGPEHASRHFAYSSVDLLRPVALLALHRKILEVLVRIDDQIAVVGQRHVRRLLDPSFAEGVGDPDTEICGEVFGWGDA